MEMQNLTSLTGLQDLNYLAIAIATLLSLVLNMVWYSPNFITGKIYLSALEGNAPNKPKNFVVAMMLLVVYLFIASCFVALVKDKTELLVLYIILTGLGITVGNVFAGKPFKLALVIIGAEYAGILIMLLTQTMMAWF